MLASNSVRDNEELWMRMQRGAWRTLAIIPASALDSAASFAFARLLVRCGQSFGQAVELADLREIRMAQVGALLEVVDWRLQTGPRVILSTLSPEENPASVAFGRAADAAALCVTVGATSLTKARVAVSRVGRERFVGTISLAAHKGPDTQRGLLQLAPRPDELAP